MPMTMKRWDQPQNQVDKINYESVYKLIKLIFKIKRFFIITN